MLPTASDLHIDALLTNISIGYKNPAYISDQIFPVLGVRKQADRVPMYDQSYWFRDEAGIRAPGTASVGGGYKVTNTPYFADRYSFRKEIPDEVRANADDQWDLDRDATVYVKDKVDMRREVAFATEFFTTGVWGTDVAGTTNFDMWSDYASSQPFIDLTTYQDTIEGDIGSEANTLVLGKAAWNSLRWHPDLMETIKYTQRGIPTEELFRSASGFDRVLIGRAIYTADPEGTAEGSVTYSRIWGKHALVIYVPSAPSLMTPAAGYTFTWARVPNSLSYVIRHRNDEREVDIIEANTYFDHKQTAAAAGVFMQNVVA